MISVIDEGAVGDGTTDDTAAIQSAVDQCEAGGTVLFPADKVYAINGNVGIKIPAERDLRLYGAEVRLKPGSNPKSRAFETVVGSKNIRLFGGTIVGDMSNVSSGGFRIGFRGDSVDGLLIEGTTFRSWKTDGVWIGGNTPSRNVRLDGVVVDEFGRNGVSVVNADGVEIACGDFRNCPVGASPGAGVDVEPNAGERVTDFTLYNCKASDLEVGFYLHPGKGEPGACYRVYACYVSGARRYGFIMNSVVDGTLVDNVVMMPPPVEGKPLPVGFSFGAATADVLARDLVLANNTAEGGTRCFIFCGIENVNAIANSGRLETVGLGMCGESCLTRNAFGAA